MAKRLIRKGHRSGKYKCTVDQESRYWSIHTKGRFKNREVYQYDMDCAPPDLPPRAGARYPFKFYQVSEPKGVPNTVCIAKYTRRWLTKGRWKLKKSKTGTVRPAIIRCFRSRRQAQDAIQMMVEGKMPKRPRKRR